jgi:hypothetical protein
MVWSKTDRLKDWRAAGGIGLPAMAVRVSLPTLRIPADGKGAENRPLSPWPPVYMI